MGVPTLAFELEDSLNGRMAVRTLFPTLVYFEKLKASGLDRFNAELLRECYQIRDSDEDGQRWSDKNYPGGYTSYASLSELFRMSSTFETLKQQLDRHVRQYAASLDMDTRQHKLEMTNCWVNIVPKHTYHGLHLHPISTISGTYYVKVPRGSGDLKFEDPRMTCFMGSIPRLPNSRPANQRFISLRPAPGKVVLFESWLRHEVLQNLSDEDRVSISFNYNWF